MKQFLTGPRLALGAALSGLCLATVAGQPAVDSARWKLLNWQIARKFPAVPKLGTAELAAWLADPARQKPVLLDVRTAAEFELSHLPGARHVEPGSAPDRPGLPKNTAIVTYCSVGYRSAEFAARLQQAGYANVHNLEGSIFQWANEDRPLEHAGKPTVKVHPYNASWGTLLKPSRR